MTSQGHPQPVEQLGILPTKSKSALPKHTEQVELAVQTVPQPHGTGDTYRFLLDRNEAVAILKDALRLLDPSPEERMIEILKRIEDRMDSLK